LSQLEEKEAITKDCLNLLEHFDSKTRTLESENISLRETIKQLQSQSINNNYNFISTAAPSTIYTPSLQNTQEYRNGVTPSDSEEKILIPDSKLNTQPDSINPLVVEEEFETY